MTAVFALAMTLVIAAGALFVYLRMQEDLNEITESSLRSRSDDVAAVVQRSGSAGGERRGPRLVESDESFAQILTARGRWIEGTSAVREPAIRPEEARRAARSPLMLERTIPRVEGTTRLLARPVRAQGQTLVVVTGASLEDRDDALAGLLRSFLVWGPIAVLLASGIGYLLVTAAFRPVEAMRQQARQISLTRGGERLPLPAAHDEIHRLGETLNDMLARLEGSFERERRLVADASHELRTPLAVLKAELETASRSGGEGADVHESIAVALEETDHLAQLAEDLLLIARTADGRLPVLREEVEVRELLERARQRFADRAHGQRREIRIDAPAGLKVAVDQLRARQALGNLIDNALRHGAGEVLLAARPHDGMLEIDVSDEGPGFSAELAPRAFERFARGGGTRTTSGAGLGLAIVRAIAEAHGGTAAIVDASSKGATMRLRIPLMPGIGAEN